MFIERLPDGSIYGSWTVRQRAGQKEIAENHPDAVGFNAGYIWDNGAYRPKTAQELDAEKTIVASAALKLIAACLLEVMFDMKTNPANYPTAASLKQKAIELYKARL